ncbi:MAG: hypothetical protein HKP03_03800 [Xanthomonadales bacterium]|nr:hypothetical protein [Xanthomonadales bacterium]
MAHEILNETGQPPELLSALAQAGRSGKACRGERVQLTEREAVSLVSLRSLAELYREGSTLIELPRSAGTLLPGNPQILCLRPREWLFISDSATPGTLLHHVQVAIDPRHSLVSNRSDAFAVFRLQGAGAPWLLGKLSGLDFLGGRAAGAHGTRTRMGDAAVIVLYLEPEDGPPLFDLLVDRSLAVYLWALLEASIPHADELVESFGEPV